jgi:TatD DNase family protein
VTVASGGWVDSHCHLPTDAEEAAAVVADAHDHGVTTMVTVGCDRASSLANRALAARFANVHHTVGLHPHEARHGVATVADLFAAGAGPAPIAVGECGLDFHYDHSPRDAQRLAFAEQIAIAHERDLPLVIHTRNAWDDTFAILDGEGVPVRTIFHCFTGGPAEARRCLERGAFISFSGIVTFPGAAEVADAVELVPEDRLLVETDSPYLAPVPHRGRRNRPAWVTAVGEFIAARRGVGPDAVRDATRRNAAAAFPLLGAPGA